MNTAVILGIVIAGIGVLMEAIPPNHKYHAVVSSIGVGMVLFGGFLIGNQIGH